MKINKIIKTRFSDDYKKLIHMCTYNTTKEEGIIFISEKLNNDEIGLVTVLDLNNNSEVISINDRFLKDEFDCKCELDEETGYFLCKYKNKYFNMYEPVFGLNSQESILPGEIEINDHILEKMRLKKEKYLTLYNSINSMNPNIKQAIFKFKRKKYNNNEIEKSIKHKRVLFREEMDKV